MPLLDRDVRYNNYYRHCRYSEFEVFFAKIKKGYPSKDKLKLPRKKLLNNKFDPNFIEERRIGLQDFIINLMKV